MIAMMSAKGVSNRTPGSFADVSTGSLVDASAIAALEFLERSREVASERVVDGSRAQTSPSEREEASAPGSGSPV